MAIIFLRELARTAALVTAAMSLIASPTFALESESIPGEYVVELREPTAASGDLRALATRLGVELVAKVRPEMILIRAGGTIAKTDLRAFENRIRESPIVARVEPNYIYRAAKLPNDPEFSKTWGLKNTGDVDSEGVLGIAGVDIGVQDAWNMTTGSKSVVVAVIDSGIDFNHPDLAGQEWTNEKELNGKPGVDDDGNGLIDDIHGYDFTANKGDATDDNEHGTHCAGVIGAKGDNQLGIVGVNWNVSLMAIKFLDKDGNGTLANAIQSIDYARKMGAHVLNNSWSGGAASELLKKVIEETNTAGILFVAAAGNQANDNDVIPTYPASFDVANILSVAAVNNRGVLAPFSNYGAKSVHVAAPGVNILSTVLNGGYASYSGTSMATPHVAGIAALMLAQNVNLTNHDLKKQIMNSSRPLFSLRRNTVAGGISDASFALSGGTPPPDPNDPGLLKNTITYSLSTDHPYAQDTVIERTINVPGAKKIAIRFSRFQTELAYDSVVFLGPGGEFVGSLSGKQDNGVTSPLIFGDTVTIRFTSDETNADYGFDIESILWE